MLMTTSSLVLGKVPTSLSHLDRSMTTTKSDSSAGQVGLVLHRRKQVIRRPHPWMDTGKALKTMEGEVTSV